MPVDHEHSRFHRTAEAKLLAPWNCPACGKINEGRRPEQGCGHCGSGDPTKATVARPPEHQPPVPPVVQPQPEGSAGVPSRPRRTEPAVEHPTRVLRLVEYLINPGQDIDGVLRRSLVGRMPMGWGSLTATIVDTIDPTQEDRLNLARRQPGVWISNPSAMADVDRTLRPIRFEDLIRRETTPHIDGYQLHERLTPPRDPEMEMPDTGPQFSVDDATTARNIVRLWGPKFANTVALALSSIAEELAGNSEPEKFLTREECLALANALIHALPPDWEGDLALDEALPPPPTTGAERTPEDQARINRIKTQMQDAATPTAVYKEPPTPEGER